ncbi:MAG: tetratricopeptide repeat protein [Ignavibacteria bacterium]|nr:tetratricopeptide repeat protein [Ignavibacteria bacterium]
MKRTKITKIILIFFLIVYSVQLSPSQDALSEKYKLALSFEKNGDFAKAEEIFAELYYQNKSKIEFFFGLVRCKKALNKFSEIVPLVEEQLQLKKQFDLLLLAGEVYWRTGNFEKGKFYWNEAIKQNPKDDSTYIKVANIQSNLRQFQLSIETLLLGRRNLKSESLFFEDLIKLFLITEKYENAIDEILKQFEITKDLSWAQAKISLLLDNKETRLMIENKLKKGKTGFEIDYKYLYAWFLYSSKEYEKALEVYKEIDFLINSNGYEVYRFGYTALNDGFFDIALKSFEFVISLGKKSPYLTNSIYGIAKATDLKLLSKGRIELPIVKSVLKKYEDALKEISDTNPLFFEIKYRIAQLYGNYLFDYETAEKILTQMNKTRLNPLILKSSLLLGDIYLYQSKFKEAERKYKEIIAGNRNSKPYEYYLAILKVGKLKYFTSEFDSAQYYFTMLIEDAPSEIANEALERSFIIERYKQFNLALSLVAQSELFEEKRFLDSAIVVLNLARGKTEGTNFEEYIFVKTIRIYAENELFDMCEKEAKNFIQKFQKSMYLEEVYYYLGLSQYKQSKNMEAINTLTELITKFSRSIFSPKARLIINNLRKKES